MTLKDLERIGKCEYYVFIEPGSPRERTVSACEKNISAPG